MTEAEAAAIQRTVTEIHTALVGINGQDGLIAAVAKLDEKMTASHLAASNSRGEIRSQLDGVAKISDRSWLLWKIVGGAAAVLITGAGVIEIIQAVRA